MSPLTPESWGWTIISWHKSGGCIATWCPTLQLAFNCAKNWESDNKDNSTTKIEFIPRQYKDRMA